MAITFEPGLYKVQTFTSLTDAQSDPFLFNNQYCMVGGKPYYKYDDQVHPVGTFVGSEASFPATGNTGVLYVDPVQQKLFYWTGAAYAEIFGTDQANYWQTNDSTDLTITETESAFELEFIATATDQGAGLVRGFVEGEIDGSTGMNSAGTWTAPTNGDYVLSAKIPISPNRDAVTTISAPFTNSTLKVTAKLQTFFMSGWVDVDDAPILFEETFSATTSTVVDVEFHRTLIDVAAGTQYRIVFTSTALTDVIIETGSEEGYVASNDRKITYYQMNGLFNSNLYPEVADANTYTGPNTFQAGLITENPDGESGSLDVFLERSGVATNDVFSKTTIDNTAESIVKSVSHINDGDTIFPLLQNETFAASYFKETESLTGGLQQAGMTELIEETPAIKAERTVSVEEQTYVRETALDGVAQIFLGNLLGSNLEIEVDSGAGTIVFDGNEDIDFQREGVSKFKVTATGASANLFDVLDGALGGRLSASGGAFTIRNIQYGQDVFTSSGNGDLDFNGKETFIRASGSLKMGVTTTGVDFYTLIKAGAGAVFDGSTLQFDEGGADRIELRYNATDNRFELYNAVAGAVLQEWRDDGSVRINNSVFVTGSQRTSVGLVTGSSSVVPVQGRHYILDDAAAHLRLGNLANTAFWVFQRNSDGSLQVQEGSNIRMKFEAGGAPSMTAVPSGLPGGEVDAGALRITTTGRLYYL